MRQFVPPGCAVGAMVLFVACALGSAARAVVIADGDGSGNTTAPADNPGWSNMAYLSNASAIYLGNRWMLSANHVADSSTIRFTDGRVFNVSPNSDIQLSNPSGVSGVTATADLKLFRLTTDPGLPQLSVEPDPVPGGSKVLMIGAGHNREPNEIGWSVSASGAWSSVPLPLANARGFAVNPNASQMRWGLNSVTSGTSISNGNTITFATQFDRGGLPSEAQAAVGDSGGGVFSVINNSWKLVGVMDTIQTVATAQPSNTVAFGEQTFSADLSQYHDQIQSIVSHAWQNQTNTFDVDHSGLVTPRDALQLINELQANGSHILKGLPSTTAPSVDVDGNGIVNTLDLSRVINILSGGPRDFAPQAQPTLSLGSGLPLTAVPEPSTALLALLGLLTVAVGRYAMKRRRTG